MTNTNQHLLDAMNFRTPIYRLMELYLQDGDEFEVHDGHCTGVSLKEVH